MISARSRRPGAVLVVAALCATVGYATAAGDEGAARIDRMEQEVVRRVNAVRRQHGRAPLERDRALARTARDYSCRMAAHRFFSHQPPDGSTLADRIRAAGKPYEVVGENLAMNVDVADPVAAAVQGWMKSRTHRDNILRREFTETGVGICRRDGSYYFTQLFLRPPS
jgi:uncharacterized protein YkwD